MGTGMVLVAVGPDGESLLALRRLAAKVDTPRTRSGRARMVDADLAFQSAMVQAGGLPRVTERFEETSSGIRMFVEALDMRYPDPEALVASHTELLDAVGAGDEAAARRCWHEHVRTAVREFLPVLREQREPALRAQIFLMTEES
jgi:DNA-binding GntR family transcriptional regulator